MAPLSTCVPKSNKVTFRIHPVSCHTAPYDFTSCLRRWPLGNTSAVPAVPATVYALPSPAQREEETDAEAAAEPAPARRRIDVMCFNAILNPENKKSSSQEQRTDEVSHSSGQILPNPQERKAKQPPPPPTDLPPNSRKHKGKKYTTTARRSSTRSPTQVPALSPDRSSSPTDNHNDGATTPPSNTASPPSNVSPEKAATPVKGFVWFSQYPGQRWSDARI